MRSRIISLLLVVALACGDDVAPPDGATDASPDGTTDASDSSLDVVSALEAVVTGPAYAEVGEEVVLDASSSLGALEYEWDFGDGRRAGPNDVPQTSVTWATPGRYSVVLTVRGVVGTRTDSLLVTVTTRPSHLPRQSSTIARLPADRMAVAVPDAAQVAVLAFRGGRLEVERRIDVPAGPRTVTAWMRDTPWLAVPCQLADMVWIGRADGTEAFEVPLQRGSRPFGAVAVGERLYVTQQSTGTVAEISLAGAPTLLRSFGAGPDARGIALAPDGRLAVTRWRSPDDNGELRLIDIATGEIELLPIAFDPQPSNDTESGGVPSYFDQILFSPDGTNAAIPSTQCNIGEGTFRSDLPLRFESTVRGVVSWLEDYAEVAAQRKLFDNRGLATAGVYSSRGDYLFVAMRGHRAVERLDTFGRIQAGSILDTGFAPDGLALSDDDRFLFVNASLSRLVQVYDVSSFRVLPRPIAEASTVETEPLGAEILRGKQLFNDSADPRLTRDGYIACAHCHLDGDSDHRVWDFTDRGEGLRRTPPLFGRIDDRPLHWSGNFDEVQDFENDIRGPFGGRGLMTDDDFEATSNTLAAPKAGLSEDLDALARYVESLDQHLPSPHRNEDGSLPANAARGRDLFVSAGCPMCHVGPALTDSGFESPSIPRLHDVGTLGPGSGRRLGAPLDGIDTPTLHGLWHQAAYLHDGSASLRAVLTTRNAGDLHGVTSGLSDAELDDLEAYLLCLDGSP